MQKRFSACGIDGVVRFPAVDGKAVGIPSDWQYSAGAYGCLQSHLAVVRMARENGWPRVLIFEDDAKLVRDFPSRLRDAAAALPGDWDAVLLGGIHREDPVRLCPLVVKLTSTNSTFAYAIRNKFFDAFLDLNVAQPKPVDENNRELQKSHRFYGFDPGLAEVDADYSDVANREVNHWWIGSSLGLNGTVCDHMLSQAVVLIPFSHDGQDPWKRAVLDWVVERYLLYSQTLEVALIDRGARPSVSREALPDRCHYWHEGSSSAKESMFREALVRFPEKEFFLFADEAIHLPNWDFRACLLKCRDVDLVRCHEAVRHLSYPDSRRLLEGRGSSIDASEYEPAPVDGLSTTGWFATKEGLGATLARAEFWSSDSNRDCLDSVRVFQSPASLMRLATRSP